MTISSDGLVGTMTIREAADRWADPRSEQLKHWAENSGVPLQELHSYHVAMYQRDRGKEATAAQVDAEIDALLALLKQIGLGEEIEHRYQPLGEAGELTEADVNALPEPVRKYIDKLRREISQLQAGKSRMENQIRKTNWGRAR